jgi:transposase InsO family protein
MMNHSLETVGCICCQASDSANNGDSVLAPIIQLLLLWCEPPLLSIARPRLDIAPAASARSRSLGGVHCRWDPMAPFCGSASHEEGRQLRCDMSAICAHCWLYATVRPRDRRRQKGGQSARTLAKHRRVFVNAAKRER